MFQSLSTVMNIYLHLCGWYVQNILSSRNTQTMLLLFNISKTFKNYSEGVVNIKYVFHSLYNWCLKYFPLWYIY